MTKRAAGTDGDGGGDAVDVTAEAATPAGRRPGRVGRDPFGFEGRDLLPDVTGDERDGGWGDERGSGSESSEAADLRRFLDEKPPHHL